MGDNQVACNPLNSRKVPITIEQPENVDSCAKESILRSSKYTEPVEKNCQKTKSPTKTQPDSARKSTASHTKPPLGKRNVRIQIDASKEEVDKKSTVQRINRQKGNLDQQNDIKSEVDFEQIQTQLEVVTLILAIINQLWLITTILLSV
jgi:hypothetical protein